MLDIDIQPEAPQPKLLSPGRTALLLDISTKTLRRWRANHLIGFVVLPSGQYRFPLSEVKRVLEFRQVA